MKKIMFNDKYALTQAVLEGRKTMTRRIIKVPNRKVDGKEVCGFAIHKTHDGIPYDVWLTGPNNESLCQLLSTYKRGEIVAVAQNYQDAIDKFNGNNNIAGWGKLIANTQNGSVGYYNKMFTRADLMPHHIRITDIKLERLQNISDEECLKEGICRWREMKDCRTDASEFEKNLYGYYGSWDAAVTPRKAFEYMIDRISGKGTWESNPWVFAYTFELVD